MQILFIDESGNPPPPSKKHMKHFVLGGVVIPEDIWHKIKEDFSQLKKRFNIRSEIKWRFFSPHNREPKNSLQHLKFEEKEIVRSTLFQIISKHRSVRIISVVTNVMEAYRLPYIDSDDDLYWYSYKQLTERFQYYLQDLTRTVGQKINGIIVCDHRQPRQDVRLRDLHQKLIDTEHSTASTYKNLVEGVFIAPSHFSIGIQLADMIAGAVFRKYENKDERFFEQIRHSFRSRNGNIDGYGLVVFPKE